MGGWAVAGPTHDGVLILMSLILDGKSTKVAI